MSGMAQLNQQITFEINTLLKISKTGKHIASLVFKAYPADKCLCVATSLKQYLLQTSQKQYGTDKFRLSFNRPHKPVSKVTIAIIKTVMSKDGIDTACYGAHSPRSASTFAVSSTNLPIDLIMKAAGWTNETTFQKFYNKPIGQS
jgi:hypothetical protein